MGKAAAAARKLDYWKPLLNHAPDPEWFAAGSGLNSLLAASLPDGQPFGVVHGDFQPGNIPYVDGRAETLIDWELTSIGSRAGRWLVADDVGRRSLGPELAADRASVA